jgi:hypothetical protein
MRHYRFQSATVSKRILTLMTLCALFTIQSSAQGYYRPYSHYRSNYGRNEYRPDVYYGFRLGLAASTVSSDDSRLDGGDTQTGLNLGFVTGIQLTRNAPLYFEMGLNYTEKGGKGTYEGKKFTYDLNYIEVPLVLKYQYNVDRDFSIQPFAGGYLACGVGGKIKNYGDREAYSSFSDDNFKRFDGGLRVGCGLAFNMLYVDICYDFGLSNICNDYFDSSKNGCFYANVGVNF